MPVDAVDPGGGAALGIQQRGTGPGQYPAQAATVRLGHPRDPRGPPGPLAVTGSAPDGGRWRVARLTPKGRSAQNKYRERLGAVENRWQERFGGQAVGALRAVLEQLTEDPARFFAGLEPPPDSWRASLRRPATLPYYPKVLHRGGFPDGS